jgi:glycosyltransferase involved in cell wall biosynthesis
MSADMPATASTPLPDAPIAYIMKRYPRLTETFILNEIRAMERLGTPLHIVSLLPPEPPPHHPMVAEVQAPLHAMPQPGESQAWRRMARAHAAAAMAAPWRYLGAIARACLWSVQSPTPRTVWKQFMRGGMIATLCRRQGIRHIHAHFANAPAAAARFASVMTGLPFSFTAHAKDLYLTPAHVIRKRALAASFVATCTGYNVQYLAGLLGGRAEKIHLVYHGIDLGLFGAAPPTAATGAQTLILSVGRLVPKKGHDDLIEACRLLHARGVSFRCRIVGAGPLRQELNAQIDASGLTGIVTLDGAMTHADLVALYRTAALFALAPRITEDGDRDGIPNVIAEAMATGVPVVSTSVSGIPELVRDGETGRLVPPRNPQALADAMALTLTDRQAAQRMAEAGRARLEGEFDLWKTTRRLHSLFGCTACPPGAAEANSRFQADDGALTAPAAVMP